MSVQPAGTSNDHQRAGASARAGAAAAARAAATTSTRRIGLAAGLDRAAQRREVGELRLLEVLDRSLPTEHARERRPVDPHVEGIGRPLRLLWILHGVAREDTSLG